MKLVIDVCLLNNVYTKDEKEKKQTLFRFMIFKSLRGMNMKKIAKTSLIALAFVLFSCGKNEQYYDSYVGLIKEHTLRYKTNGLS